MSKVNIITESKVQLPSIDELPPPGSAIPLSFFDIQYINFQRTCFVLLYPDAPASPCSFYSLRSSLACTLPHFHPSGGDITYMPSSHDVAIVCSKDSGVVVLEAESSFDILRLSNVNAHDVESFRLLVPNMIKLELPLPVLAVQFTLFSNNGVAIGISIHHAAMDGWGIFQFIDCWAKMCYDGQVQSGLPPMHDRAVIMCPHKDEMNKQALKLHAPNIPKINPFFNTSIANSMQSAPRMFTIAKTSIELLKKRIVQATNAPPGPPPMTFQVLAALFWISMAYANGLTSEDMTPTFLKIPMDCRALLEPPVHKTFTGNCIRTIFVELQGASLMAQDGLSKAYTKIAKAIPIAKKQPLEGIEGNINSMHSFKGLTVAISGSPKLQVYNADFGWGKPRLHTRVGLSDGVGVMTTGIEEGTIELQVKLKEGMDNFVHVFEEGLGY